MSLGPAPLRHAATGHGSQMTTACLVCLQMKTKGEPSTLYCKGRILGYKR